MPDYKKMYFKLFRAHSKAIEMLTQVGQETEDMAMEASAHFTFHEPSQSEELPKDIGEESVE